MSSRWFLRHTDTENNSHLFLHFGITDQLWKLYLCMPGHSWAMPKNTHDLLRCWNIVGGYLFNQEQCRRNCKTSKTDKVDRVKRKKWEVC